MQGQNPTRALERDISRLEKEIELYSQEKLCYEAQILRVRQICVCVCVCVHAETRHAHRRSIRCEVGCVMCLFSFIFFFFLVEVACPILKPFQE
jgi:hypothetical protein